MDNMIRDIISKTLMFYDFKDSKDNVSQELEEKVSEIINNVKFKLDLEPDDLLEITQHYKNVLIRDGVEGVLAHLIIWLSIYNKALENKAIALSKISRDEHRLGEHYKSNCLDDKARRMYDLSIIHGEIGKSRRKITRGQYHDLSLAYSARAEVQTNPKSKMRDLSKAVNYSWMSIKKSHNYPNMLINFWNILKRSIETGEEYIKTQKEEWAYHELIRIYTIACKYTGVYSEKWQQYNQRLSSLYQEMQDLFPNINKNAQLE